MTPYQPAAGLATLTCRHGLPYAANNNKELRKDMPKKKRSSDKWFIAVRGSYLPNSWQAWLLYVPYTAYVLGVLLYVLRQDFGIGAALFTLVPNWITALAVMTWIAEHRS